MRAPTPRILSLALATLAAGATARAAHAQPAPTANASAAAPLPSVALPPELDRVLRDYERNWQARSASGLATIFAADGFVLANGRAPVRGREAITRGYADAGGPLALRALAYSASDTTGWIIGAFATAANEPDMGKFVLALRRTRGGPWEIMADIDNMNSMPRRQPTPAPGSDE